MLEVDRNISLCVGLGHATSNLVDLMVQVLPAVVRSFVSGWKQTRLLCVKNSMVGLWLTFWLILRLRRAGMDVPLTWGSLWPREEDS